MIAYVYMGLACIFFALQYIFSKLYQKNTDGSNNASSWNLLLITIFSLIYLVATDIISKGFDNSFINNSYNAVVNVFSGGISFSEIPPSFWLAIFNTAMNIVYIFTSIPAMKRGKLSIINVYMLLGGMVLPFLYGLLFLGETPTPIHYVGVAIIILSLFPSVIWDTNKQDEKLGKNNHFIFTILCILVFLSNGLFCVTIKAQAIAGDGVSSSDFLTLAALFRLVFAIFAVLFFAFKIKKKNPGLSLRKASLKGIGKTENLKGFLVVTSFTALYAVVNTLGNFFELESAETLDATVQFTVANPVIIILSAFIGWVCFKEKLKKPDYLSLGLALLGILVFAFAEMKVNGII